MPVRDAGTGEKIGVVSSRLRFERLTDLIDSRQVAGKTSSIEFVTDQGGYFSEEINSGKTVPPIPPKMLASVVAPLVAGKLDYCFTCYEGNYLLLHRLKDFVTLNDGGIQVMIMADKAWLERESSQSRQLASLGIIAAGLLLGFAGACVLGAASLRRSARLSATLAAVVQCSDDAIISETLDGRITSWNHAAQRMFGFSAAEVVGTTVSNLLCPGQADDFPQIRAALCQGESSRAFRNGVHG